MGGEEVVVAHGISRHAIQLEGADNVEVFKFQVFSVTGVEPDAQHYREIDLAGKDELSLEAAGIKPGLCLTLVSAQDAFKAQPSTVSAPAANQRPPTRDNRWQQCCTRVYFACDDAVQPSFSADGVEGHVCAACASTCRLPNTVRFDASPRTAGFVCACLPEACLFGPRLGTEMLPPGDALSAAMLEDMRLTTAAMCASAFAEGKRQFGARLQSGVATVLEYERQDLRARARGVIPLAELEKRAAAVADPLPGRDEYLMQLMRWYKNEFFAWVNSPPCDRCASTQTSACGGTAPTAEESAFKAGVVELHRCGSCGHVTRFPRYNDTGKLIETRRGRCGEWANAFGLLCRACGFEVRHVMDWTDHVWVEVYSHARRRWLHCDPCETALDTPLMYECGWGKKLTYVVAFSRDGVVDVTRRYTQVYGDVLARRRACPEEWLSEETTRLTRMLRSSLSADARAALERRDADELEAFAAAGAKVPSGVELLGRSSGSVAWRLARGELGTSTVGGIPSSPGIESSASPPVASAACTRPSREDAFASTTTALRLCAIAEQDGGAEQPPLLLEYEFCANGKGEEEWRRTARVCGHVTRGNSRLVVRAPLQHGGARDCGLFVLADGMLSPADKGASADGGVRLCNPGDNESVVDAAWCDGGSVLYALLASGAIRVIDVATGSQLASISLASEDVNEKELQIIRGRIVCCGLREGLHRLFVTVEGNATVRQFISRPLTTRDHVATRAFEDAGVGTAGLRLVKPTGMAVARVAGYPRRLLLVCDESQHVVVAFEIADDANNVPSSAKYVATVACGPKVVAPNSVAVIECERDTASAPEAANGDPSLCIRVAVAVACTDSLILARTTFGGRGKGESAPHSIFVADRAKGLSHIVCASNYGAHAEAAKNVPSTRASSAFLASLEPTDRLRRLVRVFFHQLTQGCSRDVCSSEHCKTNPTCDVPATPNDAAARAISLATSATAIDTVCAGIDVMRIA